MEIPLNPGRFNHALRLDLESSGVTINASRFYKVPFVLNRKNVVSGDVTITYEGAPAIAGQTANSLGRFGVEIAGGGGVGFAERAN